MGVPSYFRWLAEKYGKTVVDALEDLPQTANGQEVQPDLSLPNPNGEEFDNLYLDMNGIIHPCSHPENKVRTMSFESCFSRFARSCISFSILASVPLSLAILHPSSLIRASISNLYKSS